MPEFRVTFEYTSDTEPPPGHYEYDIAIVPDEEAVIAFIPDYSFNQPPFWEREFTISDDNLEKLYRMLTDAGLPERKWAEQEDAPVGGELRWMYGSVGDADFKVPANLAEATDEKALSEIYDYINTLVPKDVWDELKSLRDEFISTYEADKK